MKFKIYQIDMDRDKNRVKFDNLENTKKHQGFEQIDAGIYDRVFMGDTDSETLEDIYEKENSTAALIWQKSVKVRLRRNMRITSGKNIYGKELEYDKRH